MFNKYNEKDWEWGLRTHPWDSEFVLQTSWTGVILIPVFGLDIVELPVLVLFWIIDWHLCVPRCWHQTCVVTDQQINFLYFDSYSLKSCHLCIWTPHSWWPLTLASLDNVTRNIIHLLGQLIQSSWTPRNSATHILVLNSSLAIEFWQKIKQ